MSSVLTWTTGSEEGGGILKARRSLIHREGGSREETAHERNDPWVEGRDSGKEGRVGRRTVNRGCVKKR